jgi:hypothetical protein
MTVIQQKTKKKFLHYHFFFYVYKANLIFKLRVSLDDEIIVLLRYLGFSMRLRNYKDFRKALGFEF